jgi:hypothetical protein
MNSPFAKTAAFALRYRLTVRFVKVRRLGSPIGGSLVKLFSHRSAFAS